MSGSIPALTEPVEITNFWSQAKANIDQGVELKDNKFPLNRIKKIMKLDEEVDMVSQETLELMCKALELFVQELTLRSFLIAVNDGRKTLFKRDIGAAVARTNFYDFLIDLVPRPDNAELNQQRQNANQARNAAALNVSHFQNLVGASNPLLQAAAMSNDTNAFQSLLALTAHQNQMMNLNAQASSLMSAATNANLLNVLHGDPNGISPLLLQQAPLAAFLQQRSQSDHQALLDVLSNHLNAPGHAAALSILSNQQQLSHQLTTALQHPIDQSNEALQQQQRQLQLEFLQNEAGSARANMPPTPSVDDQ